MSNLKASSLLVSVGTTATHVVERNDDREYALFVNDSDTTIYLCLGEQASANFGIRINANGGSYEITKINPWKGYVSAYCSASKNLLVCEW